jgi:hypothetical protein
LGSLRSLHRDASLQGRIETVYTHLRDMLGRDVRIPLQHPDFYYVSIEVDLSDEIDLPGGNYYPNETFLWQIREIEFRLETFVGLTLPYINLLLKIKVPTRSNLSWDGFFGFFSKKVVLPGDGDIKRYYKFRNRLKTEIIREGLLGLPNFPEGWQGHEVK